MVISDTSARSINPFRPSEVVAEVELYDSRALEATVAEAARAQSEWQSMPTARSLALDAWADAVVKNAEQLATLITAEVGKPIIESRAEVARTAAIIRYYAQAPFDAIGEIFAAPTGKAQLFAEHLPLGVVIVVTPWNFPVAIPAWKIAPALAYGNAVLFKPSNEAIGTAGLLMRLAHESIPPTILNYAPAKGEAVSALLGAADIGGITFTGSAEVGRKIIQRAAANGVPVQAEMGGQNPAIVLADADLEAAATTVAAAATGYAGQKCTATSRVIVLADVKTKFVSMLVEAVEAVVVGDPSSEHTTVGPLVSHSAQRTALEAVARARERGRRPVVHSEVANAEGWFFPPTVVEVPDTDDPLAQEEVFAPLVAVLTAVDENEAIRMANSTKYGLCAAVYGRDVHRATAVGRRLVAGAIRINAPTTGIDFYTPFGGERASGYGAKELGKAARLFYTKSRSLFVSG